MKKPITDLPYSTIEFTESFEVYSRPGCWCLAVAEQGTGSYFYQNVIYDFQPKDCFLLYGGEKITLSYGEGRPCRFFLFHFTVEDADLPDSAESSIRLVKHFFDPAVRFQSYSLPKKNYDSIRSYLKICTQTRPDTLPVSPMIYRHTFLAFLLYFAQTGYILKPEKKQEAKQLSSREIMVAQVKHMIRRNFADPLPLSYIAEYVYTNPSYLSRVFSADTGIQLSAFINQVRIDNARQLLENTDELIIDIAVACGFNQVPHFNRIFKELTGMSPSSYRKAKRYHNH